MAESGINLNNAALPFRWRNNRKAGFSGNQLNEKPEIIWPLDAAAMSP
jgi:hypothetical protein